MRIADIVQGQRALQVTWSDRSVSEFPFIWLRDNDRDELHPTTRERIFDLTSVEPDIRPTTCEASGEELIVRWPGKDEPSRYPAAWLGAHRPGAARLDPARVERDLWDGQSLVDLPHVDAQECARSPVALKKALLTAKRYGLVIVANLDDDLAAGEAFGARIGFKRKTNFGVMFDVQSKPDPNNLAYTSMALPLHTDLPNQQQIPGYQFLHSYRNSASGGESVFADGFRICGDFAAAEPEAYELLTRVDVPWRFHDDGCDVRRRRPIINTDANGDLTAFVFNAHIADVPDMDSDVLCDYYAAYRALMIRVRDPQYAVRHSLAAGEMVVFDNWRVLHGRTAFDADSGERHYRGYYIDENEINSCIRMLSR